MVQPAYAVFCVPPGQVVVVIESPEGGFVGGFEGGFVGGFVGGVVVPLLPALLPQPATHKVPTSNNANRVLCPIHASKLMVSRVAIAAPRVVSNIIAGGRLSGNRFLG
jgi:hypothetical protein